VDERLITAKASDDFNKARAKELFSRIVHLLKPEKKQLLNLKEVKALLRTKGEYYKGMQTVPIDAIVGSEGRYRDFNQAFLPKHEYLRERWERIDKARLRDEILPPIKLYQIGEVYFVRDGNHRVSVAKSQGQKSIDAEVTAIVADIPFKPGMTQSQLIEELLKWEKQKFITQTHLDKVISLDHLNFSTPGRFDEIIKHIQGHRYFMNLQPGKNLSFEQAAQSWCQNIFLPIIKAVQKENILSRFPGRTEADLYIWIVQHWDSLKAKYGEKISITEAARDFSQKFGKNFWERLASLFKF
jgi:hypothetical protein